MILFTARVANLLHSFIRMLLLLLIFGGDSRNARILAVNKRLGGNSGSVAAAAAHKVNDCSCQSNELAEKSVYNWRAASDSSFTEQVNSNRRPTQIGTQSMNESTRSERIYGGLGHAFGCSAGPHISHFR